jgi:uncharacterized membrane protein YdfJ with MMPL/SSD domain
MPLIEDTLRKLAVIQEKYPVLILLIVLVFTAVMAFGSLQMKLDPSYDSMIPDDAEVIRMQDVVSTEFGSTETMLVLVELDPSSDDPHAVSDIRGPRVAEQSLFNFFWSGEKHDANPANIGTIGLGESVLICG